MIFNLSSIYRVQRFQTAEPPEPSRFCGVKSIKLKANFLNYALCIMNYALKRMHETRKTVCFAKNYSQPDKKC